MKLPENLELTASPVHCPVARRGLPFAPGLLVGKIMRCERCFVQNAKKTRN